MPTILTHAALPLIAAWGVGPERIPPRLAWIGAAVAVAPDLDVLGRFAGIPVESIMGHRGVSHSIAAATVLTMLAACLPIQGAGWLLRALFLFLAALSHGLTDMLTDGGKGIALFWPLNEERIFFPVRPLEVSPILLRGFENGKLPLVLASELVWLILPILGPALLARWLRTAHIDLARGQF